MNDRKRDYLPEREDLRTHIVESGESDTGRMGVAGTIPSAILLLRKIFASLDDAVFVLQTPSRKIVMCNSAVERIFGYSEEAVLGRNTSFLHLNYKSYKKFDDITLPTLDKTGVFRGEYRMKRKDGSTFFSGHSITEIRDASGRRTFVVSVVRDITDQKVAAGALRESEAFYRNFFESSRDVIVLLDKAGNIVDINPRGEELLGYPRPVLLGMNALERLIVPEDRHITRRLIREAARGRNSVYEVRYKTKTGDIIHFDGVTVPRTSAKGEFLSTFCTLRDITDRKKAAEKLRDSSRLIRAMAAHLVELEEAERRKLSQELHDRIGQILTALSINLTIVRGQISDDLRDKITPRIDDSLSLVEEAVSRIRDIMSDLRPPVLDDFGLVAALRWYGTRFADRAGIAVKIRGRAIVPRPAPNVETVLFRIAQEALTNIAKHAKAAKASLMLKSEEHSLCLIVSDDGIGFRPSEKAGGGKPPGWGLITMAERAESLGGSFRIVSRPTRGTKVVVRVPR